MVATAPYGSWTSPISAADLAARGHPVERGAYVGAEIWWSELRPAEGGRYAVRRYNAAGELEDVLPAPWNARSRVHEYGGGAWAATPSGVLALVEFTDQRIYRLDSPGGEPVPITPDSGAAYRYGELRIVGSEVWCVRERHTGEGIVRDIAAVPLDGGPIRSIASGSHFLAGARLSPDGRQLAWIAWEHPQMPWDGTELRVMSLDTGAVRTLLGATTESVLQPEWADNGTLFVSSDRTGFWNLYRVDVESGVATPLYATDADTGGPLWTLGSGWYRVLDGGRVLTVRTYGTDTLGILDPATGEVADLDLGIGEFGRTALGPVNGDRVLLDFGAAKLPYGLRELDLATGALRDVRLSVDDLPARSTSLTRCR